MLPEPTRALVEDQVPRRIGDTLSRETADWTLDLLAHNARLVLTAGSASQTVPDVDNPFAKAVVDALDGEADMDGDGLILGTEIAQFVRGRVARATRLEGHANDPVFAIVPKRAGPDDEWCADEGEDERDRHVASVAMARADEDSAVVTREDRGRHAPAAARHRPDFTAIIEGDLRRREARMVKQQRRLRDSCAGHENGA